jgi:predicted transcriptional regulator
MGGIGVSSTRDHLILTRRGERLILVMAMKYAQRRSAENLAAQLGLSLQVVVDELKLLDRMNLVHRWSDGRWGLTSAGNIRRNHLTTA